MLETFLTMRSMILYLTLGLPGKSFTRYEPDSDEIHKLVSSYQNQARLDWAQLEPIPNKIPCLDGLPKPK